MKSIFSLFGISSVLLVYAVGGGQRAEEAISKETLQAKAATPEVQALREGNSLYAKFERVAKTTLETLGVLEDWLFRNTSDINFAGMTADSNNIDEVTQAILKLSNGRSDWSAIRCSDTPESCARYLAGEFMKNRNGLPVFLVIAMSKKESDFNAFFDNGTVFHNKPDGTGKSDYGLMQVRDWHQKGCRMDTVGEQIDCGAKFFSKLLKLENGNFVRAMSRYASGNPEPKTPRTKFFVVPYGLILWQALEKNLSSEQLGEIQKKYRKDASDGCNQNNCSLENWGPYKALYTGV